MPEKKEQKREKKKSLEVRRCEGMKKKHSAGKSASSEKVLNATRFLNRGVGKKGKTVDPVTTTPPKKKKGVHTVGEQVQKSLNLWLKKKKFNGRKGPFNIFCPAAGLGEMTQNRRGTGGGPSSRLPVEAT